MEPLFDSSSVTSGQRYTLFPISPSEEDLYKLYKKAVACFWTVEEIDFSRDREDWEKLSYNEQNFIKQVLAFFEGSGPGVDANFFSIALQRHPFVNGSWSNFNDQICSTNPVSLEYLTATLRDITMTTEP